MRRFALLLVLIGGCGSEVTRSSGSIASAVSGDAAPGDRQVVGVRTATGGVCSGALLGSNLVLTSRLCVTATPPSGPCGTPYGAVADKTKLVVFAGDAFATAPSSTVSAIEVPPGSGLCEDDLALLVLGTNVLASAGTVIVPRLTSAPVAGESYSIVGFGTTDDSSTAGIGVRRRHDGEKVAAAPACDPQWMGGKGACAGDYGAPAIDSSGNVLGILVAENFCAENAFARLDNHAAWLRVRAIAAATAGGYAAPSWTTGTSAFCPDAGVVDAAPEAATDSATAIDSAAIDSATVDSVAGDSAGPDDTDVADSAVADSAPDGEDTGAAAVDGADDSGCGCATPRSTDPHPIFLLGLLLLRRRRAPIAPTEPSE